MSETKLHTHKNYRQSYSFVYLNFYVLSIRRDKNDSEVNDSKHYPSWIWY
jgi:hypothetical protein